MRRLVVLAALLVLSIGAAGPARAETETRHDRAQDVVEVATSGTTAREHDARRDVLSIRTVHAQHVVRLVARLRQLEASGFELLWRTRTDSGTWRVEYDADTPSSPFAVIYPPGDDEPSDCTPGVHVDAARDQVALRVPRSCLDGPDWVRTGLMVRHWVEYPADALLDDARRDGVDGPARLGPKVSPSTSGRRWSRG